MLEALHVDAVAVVAAIVRPDRALGEANAIERQHRSRSVVGELLGIAEATAQPLDLAGLAADIGRGADMPRRVAAAHPDAVARAAARRAHAVAWPAGISASLRPISSAG